MISRHMQYIYKEGMFELNMNEGTRVNFVGGSPVIAVGTGGEVPSYGPPFDYSFLPYTIADGFNVPSGSGLANGISQLLGVAYHSRKVCEFTKKVTVIRAPAVITLFRGKAGMKEFQQAEEFFPFGFTEDDPFHPIYLESGEVINVGTYLMPMMITVSGERRAVWVIPTATRLGVGAGQSVTIGVPLRVRSVSGVGDEMIVTVDYDNFVITISA